MVTLVKQLEKYPFVRLVIPFIIGILCGDACPEECLPYSLGAAVVCFLLVCIAYRRTLFFGVVLYAFLFTLGSFLLLYQKQETKVEWNEGKAVYMGVITDTPQEKQRSWLLPMEIEGHKVMLYVAKDSLSETLKRGDLLRVYTQVATPDFPKVPGQFDYARYLQRHGISGTAYAPSGYWEQMAHSASPFSLKRKALEWRDSLLERYRALGFQGDELAVLSALTLGDKSELRDTLKETYSVTGASHVLALSGLHMGILYSICAFLLSFLHAGKCTRWIRMLCLVAILWSFSFIVGLSTSVVRSACMFSLFAVGQCLSRKSLSFNTLALSAFIMLLYQPFYLFDVGFQLSYVAVASIIWLYPKVFAWWNPSNRVLRYVWGLLCVSFVAQIGVAPLIIYYFSRFSVYFLLTNLLVIPLTFCLVAGTVLMLCCGFYFPLQKAVAMILNWLIKAMYSGLTWIEQMPLSAIDRISVTPFHLLCFYLFLFFFVGYCMRKHVRYLIATLCCVLCFVSVCAYSLYSTPSHQLLFYHSGRGASVQGTYKGQVPLDLFPVGDGKDLCRFCGKNVALLRDNSWRSKEVDTPLPLDYLFIQRGFSGHMTELQELFEIHQVILDTSLSSYRQERLKEECSDLGIEVFSLSEKGYLLVML